MKQVKSIAILFFVTVIFLITPNWAQSSNAKETLKQYVAQLQYRPDDSALRERIINLALTMKPKPQIPAEAVKLEGAAEYAIKNAKTEADFAAAAAAYEKALLLAPWLANDYFNCGVAYEKAGNLPKAIDAFNFYLLAAPVAPDANEVQKRIGGLEYAAEKAEKEKSEQAAIENETMARKRMVENLVTKLNNIFRGKKVVKLKTCAPDNAWRDIGRGGRQNDGCDWDEYNGKNWITYDYDENPYTVSFTSSEDGMKIIFKENFSDNSTGTPLSANINDIDWINNYTNKKCWIYIWDDGSSIMTSSSPVSPSDPSFNRNEKYSYARLIFE